MTKIRAIDLTGRERALEQAICWDVGELGEREDHFDQLDRMRELAESLFARGAVPQVRLDYLTEPKMFAGGRGKSRLQLFERHGVFGTDVFSHPHFLPFLDFFIRGPDLPVPTIQGFRRIVETRTRTVGMLLRQLLPFVREEIRIRGLCPRHAAEDMIFDTANYNGGTIPLLEDASLVREQSVAILGVNPGSTVLRAVDKMHQIFHQRL